MRRLRLHVKPGRYSVCRLPADAPLPPMAAYFSVTRTPDETSVVCEEGAEPQGARVEQGWRLVEFAGPFAFDECGILAAALAPLAEARIGIFALSTYDTDWLLIKEGNLPRAVSALIAAGHDVEGSGLAATE